jgi:uncharacterized OB-fold protein
MMARQVPYVGYLSLGSDPDGSDPNSSDPNSSDPNSSDPHLVANECASCGALFFDRRNACANCGARDFSARRLANDGVLRAFTIVHRATPDVTVPYVSGIVDLDGGGVVKANIVGIDPKPENLSLGMKLTLTTFPIGTDSEGTEAVSFGYQPA